MPSKVQAFKNISHKTESLSNAVKSAKSKETDWKHGIKWHACSKKQITMACLLLERFEVRNSL